jgi:hypothetical protein
MQIAHRLALRYLGSLLSAGPNILEPRFDRIETGSRFLILTRFLDANRFPTSLENALAIEKFHQFGDHLVRGFFHQPMPPALDQDALDIVRHHPALLDQERTAGFFS